MTKSRARYQKIQYRAKGIYDGGAKPTWVTNVWRDSRQEAVDDLRMFAIGRYTNKKIVKRTWKQVGNGVLRPSILKDVLLLLSKAQHPPTPEYVPDKTYKFARMFDEALQKYLLYSSRRLRLLYFTFGAYHFVKTFVSKVS